MPELRRDPITGNWRVIGGKIRKRPNSQKDDCIFCSGKEHLLPPEICSLRGSNGFRVRAVPEKHPVLEVTQLRSQGIGLYDQMNNKGADELLIEEGHGVRFVERSIAEIAIILQMYRTRIIDLYRDKGIRYVAVFREEIAQNSQHPLSRILGMSRLPDRMTKKIDYTRKHFRQKQRCTWCDILRQELNEGKRMVAERNHAVALVPYAPRFCNEVLILPKTHTASFEEWTHDEDLAELLKEIAQKYQTLENITGWGFILYNAPNINTTSQLEDQLNIPSSFHFHLEMIPSMEISVAEIGLGLYSVPFLPEQIAKQLREIKC